MASRRFRPFVIAMGIPVFATSMLIMPVIFDNATASDSGQFTEVQRISHFDQVSRRYDSALGEDFHLAYMKDWRRAMLSLAVGNVLEVGIGTGANLQFYPDSVRFLSACDVSRGMLRELGRKLEDEPPRFGYQIEHCPADFVGYRLAWQARELAAVEKAAASSSSSSSSSRSSPSSNSKQGKRSWFSRGDSGVQVTEEATLKRARETAATADASAADHSEAMQVLLEDAFGAALPQFDTIVDTFGLCSYEDPRAVLRHLRLLLRDEGQLLLIEHGRNESDSFWALVENVLLQITRTSHLRKFGCYHDRAFRQQVSEYFDIRREVSPDESGPGAAVACLVCVPKKGSSAQSLLTEELARLRDPDEMDNITFVAQHATTCLSSS